MASLPHVSFGANEKLLWDGYVNVITSVSMHHKSMGRVEVGENRQMGRKR
jgi:hypothetical protein